MARQLLLLGGRSASSLRLPVAALLCCSSSSSSIQQQCRFASHSLPQVRTDDPSSSLPSGLNASFAQLGLAASSAAAAHGDISMYTVKVVTGRRRGAGTTDPVAIELIGAHGRSDKFLLDTQDRGFERGSSRVFSIPVSKDIGPLRRVHIEKQDTPAYELGRGWYLRQIEIESASGDQTLFPCNAWLGDSDCGDYKAPCERNLLPAAAEMIPGQQEPVHMSASGMAIPHPEKVMKQKLKGVSQQGGGFAGEDAYFYCEGRNQLFGMGVADGIYAWREAGIDSGIMSQTLMRKSRQLIEAGTEDVFKVLQSSSRHVMDQGLQGSCTACVLTINQSTGQLHAANLGDSGFLVLGRPHRSQTAGSELEVKFRTNQLEHEFGRPFQIGHHEHASGAEDADMVSFFVSRGDVIVMGSDGLLDNLGDAEIAIAVTQLLARGAGPSQMVQMLVKLAFDASLDKSRATPYAREASEAFDMVYSGGKQDDITVLVAQCK